MRRPIRPGSLTRACHPWWRQRMGLQSGQGTLRGWNDIFVLGFDSPKGRWIIEWYWMMVRVEGNICIGFPIFIPIPGWNLHHFVWTECSCPQADLDDWSHWGGGDIFNRWSQRRCSQRSSGKSWRTLHGYAWWWSNGLASFASVLTQPLLDSLWFLYHWVEVSQMVNLFPRH